MTDDALYERIAKAMLADLGYVDKLDSWEPGRRILTIQLSSRDFLEMAEVAVKTMRMAASEWPERG